MVVSLTLVYLPRVLLPTHTHPTPPPQPPPVLYLEEKKGKLDYKGHILPKTARGKPVDMVGCGHLCYRLTLPAQTLVCAIVCVCAVVACRAAA